jgi:phage terminase large subunit
MIAAEIRAAQARAQASESEREFEAVQGARASHEAELARCRDDVVYWLDHWGWTYDPRLLGKKAAPDDAERVGAYVRFHPWPKQVEFLRWLEGRAAEEEPGVCEKSRDQGATYLAMAFCLHRWLFQPGFKATCTSYEDEKVDNLDDPDSMFEKLRIMLRRLPEWMLPDGFNWHHHDLSMRLINPANGAIITGESGKTPGRAGRSTIYFVDEADFLAHPQLVEAALSGNTDCVIWMSTYNPGGGPGSYFVRKRNSEALRPEQVFVLDWRDDPRKDAAWAANKKANLVDPLVWEFEYERNYQAATEGICIPAKWVAAAQRVYKLETNLKVGRRRIAGVDVGAGKAFSVYIDRAGAVVGRAHKRADGDTTGTAFWALELARKRGAQVMNYDAVGVGAGVTSTFSNVEHTAELVITPINTGLPPSDRLWPDQRTSAEIFVNIRAEAWWLARTAIQRTYEHVLFLEGLEGGVKHPLDELIALPNDKDSAPLISQLSMPKWKHNDRGKIIIESKLSMKNRGIPSPDFADAFVMTMIEPPDIEASGIFKRPWFRLWPHDKKLPEFSYIVMSVRTSFDDEKKKPKERKVSGPVCCGIYGVFNINEAFKEEKLRKAMGLGEDRKYAALLCDYWSEPLSFGETLEKVREAYRTKFGSPGHRPGLVIVEEGGHEDISLRHALAEYKVPAWPFATEQSHTMRAHEAAVLVEQGGFFVPESSRDDRRGKFRDWAEPMVRAACSFTGKGSIETQGPVDQLTAALVHLMLRDTLKAAPKRLPAPDPDEKTAEDEREAVEIYEQERRGRRSAYGE